MSFLLDSILHCTRLLEGWGTMERHPLLHRPPTPPSGQDKERGETSYFDLYTLLCHASRIQVP